jgi:hypothetical protein
MAGSALVDFLREDVRTELRTLPEASQRAAYCELARTVMDLVREGFPPAATAPEAAAVERFVPRLCDLLEASRAVRDRAAARAVLEKIATDALSFVANEWGARRGEPELRALFSKHPVPSLDGGLPSMTHDVRPRRPARQAVALCDYAPANVSELQLFTWHAGRCVTGTVERAAPGLGVHCLLRCEPDGTLFKAALFIPHGNVDVVRGVRITILDPYITVDRSGARSLRVDHPSDVVLHNPAAVDLVKEKEIANGLIKKDKCVPAAWPSRAFLPHRRVVL